MWTLPVAIIGVAALLLRRSLFGYLTRRGKAIAAKWLGRASYLVALSIVALLAWGQIRLLDEGITLQSVVYCILMGLLELVLLTQWVVGPIVGQARNLSLRRGPGGK